MVGRSTTLKHDVCVASRKLYENPDFLGIYLSTEQSLIIKVSVFTNKRTSVTMMKSQSVD